ncbi:SBBP repeat-containing protein [Iningainema tapete]|uniref:SBBP repeat-containing protein n=1 Tax=Iningainema tapete BLCC-T55 TaxID=2748662 RepID=A0A8J6XG28_9CYAN|nr:SBBP repeat-containing protein [Iningainema tapete]MBD2775164.1 SBBP repeat-containing protein [Iningainema tapete BLCC-T55]
MKLKTPFQYGSCALIFSLSLMGLSKLVAPLSSVAAPKPVAVTDAMKLAHVSKINNLLPLNFEANQGQTDKQVKFLSRGNGYSMFLTPKQVVLTLMPTKTTKQQAVKSHKQVDGTILQMEWVGANQTSQVLGLNTLSGKSNYFIGKNPKNWHTNIPTYAKVQYRSVYPGIDLVFYGNQRQLEYDWVVAAGADPRLIRLKITGADRLSVDKRGDLVLHIKSGEVRQHRPRIYQQINGQQKAVAGKYVLLGKQEVGFAVANYDQSKALVIDPVLSYSTYLGGSSGNGNDAGFDIAVDLQGNAYVTGQTGSLDFPTKNAFDSSGKNNFVTFVTKINPAASGDASLVYSTYLGGNNNPQGNAEVGYGIAVDFQGNVYVTGISYSSDFPTTENALSRTLGGLSDAFVTKLNASGSRLLYSTYLGGSTASSSGSSADFGRGIAVDLRGNIYVTGEAYSSDFPTKNAFTSELNGGINDIFVTKLNPNASGEASLLYSSYLGGNGFDTGFGIAVDLQGNAYVTGLTNSTNFPTKNALDTYIGVNDSEAFVTKVNPNASGEASLLYSTYLGGSSEEFGRDIAVDLRGNAYVTGRTQSTDFPTKNAFDSTLGGSQDAFVTKVNPSLSGSNSLVYSTYLGGSVSNYTNTDEGSGIAVDLLGNAYITGSTSSTDFPIQNAFNSTISGLNDAFVTTLNARGSRLLFSSYLGGSNFDNGYGIAVDFFRNIYVTGNTTSTDFPTNNAFDNTLGGFSDAFVTKINWRDYASGQEDEE